MVLLDSVNSQLQFYQLIFVVRTVEDHISYEILMKVAPDLHVCKVGLAILPITIIKIIFLDNGSLKYDICHLHVCKVGLAILPITIIKIIFLDNGSLIQTIFPT